MAWASPGLGAAQPNDWLVVPGKRVGPISAATSRAELVLFFGASNVAALAVLWRDDRLDHVQICYVRASGPCKWHTGEGVSLGTSLTRLEALNGLPFLMEPWSSDVAGNITSWLGGRLADKYQLLRLTLDWNPAARGPTPQRKRALDEIDRLHRARSNDPGVRALQPVVSRMVIFLRK